MGWRFRKSFKIFPGVRINIGKKGLTSTTVGKRGISTSVGKRGIFQNIGIPGTGLSYRSPIANGEISVLRPLIILGAAAFIFGGIALILLFVVMGRTPGKQQVDSPTRAIENVQTTPLPRPSNSTAVKTETNAKRANRNRFKGK
ncbi:MAG: DUF4236 domain-containing protein [Acidobacteriota bacterium]